MKIKFDDVSYVEMTRKENKIHIILSARDGKNPRNTIINSAEISVLDFQNMARDMKIQLKEDVESSGNACGM